MNGGERLAEGLERLHIRDPCLHRHPFLLQPLRQRGHLRPQLEQLVDGPLHLLLVALLLPDARVLGDLERLGGALEALLHLVVSEDATA